MTISRLPPAATILDALLHPPARRSDERFEGAFADVMDPILALHRNNAKQWDREDDARRDDADDAMVATAKRDIDRMNSARHGFIETIDRAIQHAIDPCEGAPLVTESPGMAIDRLSVLVIRTLRDRSQGGQRNGRCPDPRRTPCPTEQTARGTRRGDRHVAQTTWRVALAGLSSTRASSSTGPKTPDELADGAQRNRVEPVATTIEADDELIAHHCRMSDTERVRGQPRP